MVVLHVAALCMTADAQKIQRVCKSSLSAEGLSALTAADHALWTQALLRGISTGAYEIRHISPHQSFRRLIRLGFPQQMAQRNGNFKKTTPKDILFPHPVLLAKPKCLRMPSY